MSPIVLTIIMFVGIMIGFINHNIKKDNKL
jgi:hypothetical protein